MEGDSGDTLDNTKLLKSRSMANSDTSEFLTSYQDISPSFCNEDSQSLSDFPPSSSTFVSTRIEQMMQTRSEYASAVEFEIEASKDHWSQVESEDAEDEVTETNLEVFQSLQKEWGGFFYDHGDRLKVGRKIAEGGQAEIYEGHIEYPNGNKVEYALKVFKEGYSLRDLQKQWPDGMLQKIDGGILTRKGYLLYDGTLLQDGRFAFRMQRCWGDLRKLIDLRMLDKWNRNRCFPFTNEEATGIMIDIAEAMRDLHEKNIVHRDLKASNVLIYPYWESEDLKVFDPRFQRFQCDITDYECSRGVVGTGFWRAPEILLSLRNNREEDHEEISHLFTEKSDVFSYGMTCYEVITGCIPFEGVRRDDYDHVLCGGRPKLPDTIELTLKVLLNRCWHQDALERPTFQEILQCLRHRHMHH